MTAAMCDAVHVLLPGREVARLAVRPRESIRRFLKRAGWSFTLPTIAMVNGKAVLRKDWTRRVRKGEVLVFVSRPRGGSASTRSILGLLGVLALTALAPGIGATVSGALFGGSAAAAQVVGGLVSLGGIYALNSLVKTSPGNQGGTQETVYSFGQGSNSARLLQTIPVSYGRVKKVPDYAAAPWSEFEGDDQYLHVILVNGAGKYRRDQILVADTVLWDRTTGLNSAFPNVEIQACDPGQPVTLFPANVQTASEVSGQEITTDWLGGFIANSAGTVATTLALDFVLPNGLYSIDDDGDLRNKAVQVIAEYRLVDNAGAPIGDWVPLTAPVWNRRTRTPVRFSQRVTVAGGRYEVRVRRPVAAATDGKSADNVLWQGLRAFIQGDQVFNDVSVTALRMKATDQLSGDAAQQLALIDTRILPVWTGSGFVDQPTRRPAWAFLDMASNAVYGGRRALSKIDVQAVVDLAALNDSRGETFDYTFSAATPCQDALDQILAGCRAQTRWIGDTLSLFREQWAPLPSMLLTDREIVRDSISLKYDLLPSTAADGVIVEYVDETTWQAAEVVAPRGASPSRPERRQLPGVTSRAQAQLEADFLWRSYRKRRVGITLDTEHDGRLLARGDQIIVQSNLPKSWGESGEVLRRESNALILHPAPTWGTGTHYLMVRRPNGKPWGPVRVTRGVSDAIALLNLTDLATIEARDGALNDAIARVDGSEGAGYAFGLGVDWQKRCLVTAGRPSGDRVTLDLLVDDASVHDEDDTEAPPLPSGPVLTNPRFPEVAGLAARIRPNEHPPILDATWFPAAGAVSYVCRVTYDEGESYTPLGEVRSSPFSTVVEPAGCWFEVAAINVAGLQGAWSRVVIGAPVIGAENIPITVDNFEQGLKDQVERNLNDSVTALQKKLTDMAALLSEQDAGNWADRKQLLREIKTSAGRVTALFREEITVATGPDSALAEAITELEAAVGEVEANLNVRFTTTVGPAGALAAYQATVKVSDSLAAASAAFRMVAFSDGAGGAYSSMYVEADRFVVGSSATGTFVPTFQVDSGTGVVTLRGDLIASGSITAAKMSVATLSSIVANLGTVTTGRILSTDGKLDINATGPYILMYD